VDNQRHFSLPSYVEMNLKKYQEYYSSLLQLKPYKIVEAGGLAQKKTIQPTFSIGKACTKSGPLALQFSSCGF
jgi:hypothetical protein